jgi:hypothetical protein
MQTPRCGVSLGTLARVVAQLPVEKLLGKTREPERAMLLSYLVFDAFKHQRSFVTLIASSPSCASWSTKAR